MQKANMLIYDWGEALMYVVPVVCIWVVQVAVGVKCFSEI